MTGYTALTNHVYVTAYQAELRADLRNTGSSKGRREVINTLAERWLSRTGISRTTRAMATANQMR